MRVAYTGENFNHTNISKAAFEKSAASMFNCPVVANYDIETSKIGGHDIGAVEIDDKIHYVNLTQPVGVIPESATYYWETLDDNGTSHDYFCIDGVILWKRQPCYAKLRENGSTAQSIEISVNNAELNDGILHIQDFEFEAFCLLERDEPCFEQAALQVFSKDEFQTQLYDMLKEYKEAFQLQTQDLQTGGVSVANTTKQPEVTQPQIYSLTANQLREALHRAFNEADKEDDYNRYYVEDWDDTEVYVFDYKTGRIYGFEYTVSGDDVTIDYDSMKEKKLDYIDVETDDVGTNAALAEVITSIVDAAENEVITNYQTQIDTLNTSIQTLTAQNTELLEFRQQTLIAQRAEQEAALFNKFDPQLQLIADYQTLKENASNYTLEELETQCFALIGKQKFSISKDKTYATRLPVDPTYTMDNDAYGGLLKNKNQI